MKTIIITFIASFIMFASLRGQGEIGNANWEVLNNWVNFDCIDFVNDQVGWLAGDGALLKTEDGGDTWINIPINSKWRIINIDFINENVGWGIGYYHDEILNINYDNIIKSADGGLTWTTKKTSDISFTDIYAVNDSVVYVAASKSYRRSAILKTSDGGENWIDVSQDEDIDIYSMCFFNADSGIVAGDNSNDSGIILQTFDGGNSWRRITDTNIRIFNNLQFFNDSTGYFLAVYENYESSICFTSDACNSWTTVTDSSLDIECFDFFDDDKVCAVINDSIQWHQIMISTDGGITWGRTDLPTGMNSKIYCYNPNLGYVFSEIAPGGWGGILGKILYKSIDGGNNWPIQQLTYPLYDLVFFDRNTGFISGGVSEWHGGNGDLFKTMDGGNSWINSFHSSFQVKSISFTDPQTGFILSNQTRDGTNSNIHKTTNGGVSWNEVYADKGDSIGLYFAGEEICFLNESVGWVAGSAFHDDTSGAAFLHTENGGDTWNVIWIDIDSEDYHNRIYSLYFLDSTAGWAIGESGLIVKYSDNQWQVQPRVSDLPVKDVFFSDEKHGWIAGGYLNDQDFQSIILKTTDGGITWQDKMVPYYIINDMFFEDSLNGFAVGNDTSEIDWIGSWQPSRGHGVILKTNDGGENWSVVIDSLSASLTALYYKDGCKWAIGETGLLLKFEYRKFWVSGVNIDIAPYAAPGEDTACISAMIPNPANCALEVSSVIKSQDGAFRDTITMLNQGNDLWKGYWPVIQGERFYAVDLLLTQTDTTDISDTYLVDSRFTTSGPLVVQDVLFSSADTIPNPGDNLLLFLEIKNEGLSNTITNIKVKLTILESYASVNSDWKTFMDIPPGGLSHSGEWKLTLSEDCPYDIEVPIKVDIASNGYVYWNDTISVFVERPSNIHEEDISLPKLYPNPVRDILNIELSASVSDRTIVELYNTSGIVVYKQEYKASNANSVMKIDISGMLAGIYFVKVRQERDVRIDKLIIY